MSKTKHIQKPRAHEDVNDDAAPNTDPDVSEGKKLKEKVMQVLSSRQGDDSGEPLSDTYVLMTAAIQEKSSVRDLPEALRTPGLINKVTEVYLLYTRHRIGRAVSRYLVQRGKLSAGGISFMAIFSMAGIATVGWTLFAMFFHSNPKFQQVVADAANQFIPGVVRTASDPDGLIDPNSLTVGTGTLITGVVAFLVALWAASRVVRYLSEGVRSMFGLLPFPGRSIAMYPRSMLGLLLLLLAVLASGVLTLASDLLLQWLTELFKADPPFEHTFGYALVTQSVPFVIDTLMFVVLIRIAAGVRSPKKTLWGAALLFGIASLGLRSVGGALIHSTTNPLTTAATTVVTVLVWVNLLSRIALFMCAWMADPPATMIKVDSKSIHLHEQPNYVSMTSPETLLWPRHPVTGDLIPARALTVKEAEATLNAAANSDRGGPAAQAEAEADAEAEAARPSQSL